MTWWTRHDTIEPELSDDEAEDEPQDSEKTQQDGKMKIDDKTETNVADETRMSVLK